MLSDGLCFLSFCVGHKSGMDRLSEDDDGLHPGRVVPVECEDALLAHLEAEAQRECRFGTPSESPLGGRDPIRMIPKQPLPKVPATVGADELDPWVVWGSLWKSVDAREGRRPKRESKGVEPRDADAGISGATKKFFWNEWSNENVIYEVSPNEHNFYDFVECAALVFDLVDKGKVMRSDGSHAGSCAVSGSVAFRQGCVDRRIVISALEVCLKLWRFGASKIRNALLSKSVVFFAGSILCKNVPNMLKVSVCRDPCEFETLAWESLAVQNMALRLMHVFMSQSAALKKVDGGNLGGLGHSFHAHAQRKERSHSTPPRFTLCETHVTTVRDVLLDLTDVFRIWGYVVAIVCYKKSPSSINGYLPSHKTRQDKTRQDKTRQGKTRQDKARHDTLV
jgi:hypothetical protein